MSVTRCPNQEYNSIAEADASRLSCLTELQRVVSKLKAESTSESDVADLVIFERRFSILKIRERYVKNVTAKRQDLVNNLEDLKDHLYELDEISLKDWKTLCYFFTKIDGQIWNPYA